MSISQAIDLALEHHRAGRLGQAEAIYRQVLGRQPTNPDALHFLGLIAHEAGRYDVAAELIGRAIASKPDVPGYYTNLAESLRAMGRLDEAERHCRNVIARYPTFAEGYGHLGAVLHDKGRLEEALIACRRSIELKPGYAKAHLSMGDALRDLGRPQEALAAYSAAVQIAPRWAMAQMNLGTALLLLNRSAEAVAAFERAVALKPDLAPAHANRGYALWQQGGFEEAEAAFGEALRLGPTPRLRIVWATLLPPIYQSMEDMRRWRQRLIDNIRELHQQNVRMNTTWETAPTLFYLAYHGLNDRQIQQEVARLYIAPPGIPETAPRSTGVPPVSQTQGVSESSSTDAKSTPHGRDGRATGEPPATGTGGMGAPPMRPSLPLPLGEGRGEGRSPTQRLRIGFISERLRNHTIGRLNQGLIAQLSREHFEVSVLSVGRHRDMIADYLRAHCDHYVELPANLSAARQLVADQKLDILFYTDIGMDPFTYTLAHTRLAPVQCMTWGHPSTTGIPTVDYFISSELLEAGEADAHYTEKLVRLKNLAVCYHRPAAPDPLKPRSAFGLPEEAHLYGCPQTLFKFHPEFDVILAGILRGDPQGLLVLLRGNYPEWDKLLMKRFAATMPDVVDRIRFLDHLEHGDFLNLNAIVDVLLEPIHFGGGNTSYEGFAMGTPIVTMPSPFLRGRITYALYRMMDLMDCVVATPQQYIDLAVRLGTDRQYNRTMRQRILASNGVLYENTSGVRELERFFLRVCQ